MGAVDDYDWQSIADAAPREEVLLIIIIIFRKLVSIYFVSFRLTCDGVGDIIIVGNERLRGQRVLL